MMQISDITQEVYGDRVNLIALSMDYLDDMWEYSSDSRLYEHFEFGPQKSREETKKYLERLIQRAKQPDAHWWFIQFKEMSKVVGTIGVHDIDMHRQSCEISYGVSPQCWGKGVFISALRLALDVLILNLSFHRITATTSSDNARSINALRKLGFAEEGLLRDFYRDESGRRFNATILSLLSEEYKVSSQEKL